MQQMNILYCTEQFYELTLKMMNVEQNGSDWIDAHTSSDK